MSKFAYAGAFNYQGAQGITICRYDDETGTLEPLSVTAGDLNAGALTLCGDILYATDEQDHTGAQGGGRIVTFRIDGETGQLERLDERSALFVKPSYITVDATGNYLLVTHFTIGMPVTRVEQTPDGKWESKLMFHSAGISLYRRNADGTPGELVDVYVPEKAKGGKPSFSHKAVYNPQDGRYAYCDLGADEIGFFTIDYEQEKIRPAGSISCDPFCGPRHAVIHPSLPLLYLNYERKGAVTRCRIDGEDLEILEDTSVLREGDELTQDCNQSEILMNAAGTRLYDLMRGLGLLYVFAADSADGALSLLEVHELDSKVPRGMTLTADEKFLLLACNDTECVEAYRVLEDGRLEKGVTSEKIAHPASIVIL